MASKNHPMMDRMLDALELADIRIRRVLWTKEPDLEDDEIEVNRRITIQVGVDYVAVVRLQDDNCLVFFEATDDPEVVVRQLQNMGMGVAAVHGPPSPT